MVRLFAIVRFFPVFLLLSATGCARTLTLQTARTVPADDGRTYLRAGGALTRGSLLEFDDARRPGKRDGALPVSGAQLEYEVGYERGLSDSFQWSIGLLAPAPAGIGARLGAKAQLVGDRTSSFGLAVLGDAAVGTGGASSVGGNSGGYYLADLEATAVASWFSPTGLVLYGAPKAKWLTAQRVTSRVEQEGPLAGLSREHTSAAQTALLGLGVGAGYVESNGRGFLGEVSTYWAPPQRGRAGVFAISAGMAFQRAW